MRDLNSLANSIDTYRAWVNCLHLVLCCLCNWVVLDKCRESKPCNIYFRYRYPNFLRLTGILRRVIFFHLLYHYFSRFIWNDICETQSSNVELGNRETLSGLRRRYRWLRHHLTCFMVTFWFLLGWWCWYFCLFFRLIRDDIGKAKACHIQGRDFKGKRLLNWNRDWLISYLNDLFLLFFFHFHRLCWLLLRTCVWNQIRQSQSIYI